ncbi:hypothetical protein GGTG_01251 [Gaeumannomyces tritici R3-111a-1]|uniref:Uncharacterized protein n=1 Tax=Gaeumannomyces tritici (strain R3-111a-1) TaxID=644352 RepID=J3NJ17_GAET3|nr:hypothetical protein GGTG_01251 [Gaeumannomyces tritici R3-111a-1]EJT81267.1 hypothetical protein GGTG_01251 [Gaeumannomyces tritici R3-111a-1]
MAPEKRKDDGSSELSGPEPKRRATDAQAPENLGNGGLVYTAPESAARHTLYLDADKTHEITPLLFPKPSYQDVKFGDSPDDMEKWEKVKRSKLGSKSRIVVGHSLPLNAGHPNLLHIPGFKKPRWYPTEDDSWHFKY